MSTIQENWVFPIKEKFKLTKEFLEKYEDKEVSWGPLGQLTFMRTYSRKIDKENRMENWWETCKRITEGTYTIQLNHCKNLKLEWNQWSAQKSAQEFFDKMFTFKWSPPGRGLYNMGTNVVYERSAMYLFNCSMVTTKYIDNNFPDPFCFVMDASMVGVGCGYDLLGKNKIKIQEPTYTDEQFIVEDSKEGWCSILRIVLDSYVGKSKQPTNINYSLIRPEGSPIKSSGGKCPGSGPLIKCINSIIRHLNKKINKNISSGDIVDLMNYIGVAVVSGGKRRTALLSLGEHDDEEYVELKDPSKYPDELLSHRWSSNNSIVLDKNINYDQIAKQISTNGEPGLINLDSLRHYGRIKDGYGDHDLKVDGTNPCGEIGLSGGNGASGELCNLSHVFPANHDTFDEFKRTLKYAYLYCKSVTIIPTHNYYTNSIILKNRRLGISLSGITDAIQKFGATKFFEWCDKGYEYVKQLDIEYSDWLCIPRSIKLTTVAPTGTVSLLSNSSPGLHFPHSEYYIRRIRIDKLNPILDIIKKAGYKCEESVYGDNSIVVEFPVKTENFSKGKSQASMWEQMELGAKLQYYWSDNSLSQTCTFKKEEERDLKMALELYRDRLKTISLLPLTDSGYQQMPYEAITKDQYENMIKHLKILDFSPLTSTHEIDVEERFCQGDKCELSIGK